MKTILAAWIAAILLLLLASVVLAGPDEDARAALALARIKAPAKAACSCGASCACDVGQCGDGSCPTAMSACFTGRIQMGYGQWVLRTSSGKLIQLATTDAQEDDCKAWSMTDREAKVCGTLSADGVMLTVVSIGAQTAKADAPSASQQRQIDALPPGTVYQIRRPDGTLGPTQTKPGLPAPTPAAFRVLPLRWSSAPQMCSAGGA